MKKKVLTLVLACSFLGLWAQRTITGIVVSADDKSALEAVTVFVGGTTNATNTDSKGNYSIVVDEKAKQLVFSYTGFKTQTVDIGPETVVNVQLADLSKEFKDVVVTALGVKREQRSLGYTTQKVSGEEVSAVRDANLINNLQGKVAGVQISGSSGLGGSSRIVMRGIKSIDGNNQPLFVVDGVPIDNYNNATADQERGALGYDYGNAAADINPDDIASVDVLKGAAASALYGERGANGVIMITTKKGSAHKNEKGKSPIGVSISQSVTAEQVSVLPNYQNEYGGGASTNFKQSVLFPGKERVQFGYDGSWGPKFANQQVLAWDAFDPNDPSRYGKTTEWKKSPNDVKTFYKTGVTSNTNVSLDGGNDKGGFRLSFSNLSQKGVFENSSLDRFTLSLSANYNLSKVVFTGISASYVNQNGKGRPQTGYSNITSSFNQWWERQMDINGLRNYQNPDGSQRTWNRTSETNGAPLYWDNPFWTLYKNYETDRRDRVFGSAFVGFHITDWLTLKGTVMNDFYVDGRQERNAVGSVLISKYSENQIVHRENNFEGLITAHKLFKNKFDVSALLGGNIRDTRHTDNLNETQGGLAVPDWYSMQNSNGPVKVTNYTSHARVNSVFGNISLGYASFVFLDFTARNDWSSTLPVKNSSYFYPGVSASLVYSELVKSKWLSYGKLRGGWSQSGIAATPHSVETRAASSQPFGANGLYVIPGTANNNGLQPERINSWEIGTELRLWVDRVNFDLTFYNQTTKNSLFSVQQSGASGYAYRYVNAAEMNNKGVEFASSFVPVRLKNSFEWGVSFNIGRNWNKVVRLYKTDDGQDVQSVILTQAPFAVNIEARPGMAYGQIVGTDYSYDAKGNKIIDPSTGLYVPSASTKPLGSILPEFTGGISTWVSFKGIKLFALFDFQKGGNLFSLTNTWGKYSGTLAETTKDGVREKGLVLDGVNLTGYDANGNAISDGTKNTTKVAAIDHFQSDNGYTIAKADVYDASFVKFRELRLTYQFPEKLFSKLPIRSLTIGFIGRNIAILKKNVPNIDPEAAVSSSNIQGLEGGQIPTNRSLGGTISFKF